MRPEPPDAETAELLRLASDLVARAGSGEQVEAFVAASDYTTVRVHGGEVEEFTSASGRGIGVRVVRDHRQGFAWAGTLEPDALLETLAEARDNARYAEPEDWVGLAEPDGVAAVPCERFDPAVAALPAERKVEMALELERMVRSADHRITGVRSAAFGDSVGRFAVASSTGIAGVGRGASCSMGVSALAADGDETYTGAGSTVGFSPGDLDLDEAATDAVLRATRLFGARPVASQRVAIVAEPRVAATIVSMLGSTLAGDRVVT